MKTEEEQFARTLERGLALLDDELSKLTGETLDGETAFRLYDTYGFPVDLTADVCRERNIRSTSRLRSRDGSSAVVRVNAAVLARTTTR
ncbi:alanine--tRNA ligase-related protein [Shigella flexneri]